MSSVATPNLVGITGLARRLVMDGHLSEADARTAIDEATKIKQPIHAYLAEKRLASAAQIAMAQSSEFGMPIFDVGSLDINQAPVKLVDEKLINAHKALPHRPRHCCRPGWLSRVPRCSAVGGTSISSRPRNRAAASRVRKTVSRPSPEKTIRPDSVNT